MKILMLNYEFPPIGGGGGKAFLHLLEEYAKKDGLRIDVLTTSANTENLTEIFSENITIYKVGICKKNLHFWTKFEVIKWLFKAEHQLKELLSKNDYNLAHAFFGFPTGWLTYRKRKNLPYIISLRGSDVPGANPRLKLDYKLLGGLFRKIWKNADLRVANSKGLAQRAKLFAPELHYDVIANGVDTNRFAPVEQKPPMKPFRLLAVGRLTQVKQLDLAIQSIYHVRKLGLDAEFTIAGNGNLIPQLRQLAEELKITQYAHFIDWIEPEKIPALYRDHHAFLLTSINEGMSNAMLEAMASGLPIITTACEGTEELVTKNGVIVHEPTAENIAKAILETAGDLKEYGQMASTSRERAAQFSWAGTAEKYLQLYQTIRQN